MNKENENENGRNNGNRNSGNRNNRNNGNRNNRNGLGQNNRKAEFGEVKFGKEILTKLRKISENSLHDLYIEISQLKELTDIEKMFAHLYIAKLHVNTVKYAMREAGIIDIIEEKRVEDKNTEESI